MVASKAAWISPASVLRIPVPVTAGSKFLSLEFTVTSGGSVDFDVMLESEDEESATRLYGPSRRAQSVSTCLPLPHPGVAFVTFDNIGSWLTAVQIKYTLRLSAKVPEQQATVSRLRFGSVIGPSSQAAAAAAEEDDDDEEVRQALAAAQLVEVTVAAGAMEEVELRVSERTHMYVSVDVAKGRDVDFGIMLVQPGVDGADDPPTPSRLFGPCHRATNLSANGIHAGAQTLD